eukprot:1162062-Pelagomonas_calceolata.AAC.18
MYNLDTDSNPFVHKYRALPQEPPDHVHLALPEARFAQPAAHTLNPDPMFVSYTCCVEPKALTSCAARSLHLYLANNFAALSTSSNHINANHVVPQQ